MDTRIEIYKKQKWIPLRLKSDASIKYNAVINKIGKVASREISHTNTFSLPYIYENISALGLNNFNPAQMAQAMNQKYIARYYVEEKLVQSGFIVINNSRDGVIKVNFIDEALGIIEKWGSSTYEELLNNTELDIPQVYADAIAEMKTFALPKTTQLGKLSEVTGKGFNLAVFPNNLNQIGDKFQINTTADDRLQDVYNPYQTRPVYNVKAFLDMITLSYGYTPDYNNSVNWDRLEETFITSESPDKNKKGENGLQTVAYPQITSSSRWRWITTFLGDGYVSSVDTFFQGYSDQCIRPIDIPNWVDPEYWDSDNPGNSDYFYDNTWFEQYSVFQPNLDTGNFGTIRYTAAIPNYQPHLQVHELWFIYKNETLGGDVVINEWSNFGPDYSQIEVASTGSSVLDGDYIMGDIPGTFNSGTGSTVFFQPGGDFQFFYKTNGSGGWCVIAKRKTDGQFTSFADGSEWLLCQTTINPATWNSSFTVNSNYTINDHVRMTDENLKIDNRFYGPRSGEVNQDNSASNLLWSFDQDLTTGNFILSTTEYHVDLTFNKVFLDKPVNGAGDLIGIIYNYKQSFAASTLGGLSGMVIEETFLPPGVVAFDKFGQYIPDVVDMTHGASKKTLKFILAGIMHKEGILMDINAKLKTIKFFSYGHYRQQQLNGNFSDWSNYLLEYDQVVRSTDYGNAFAQINRIGLSSPFQGNTYDVNLDNQGANTKYKDFTENYVKGFKDIQNVREIDNTGTDKDFFEYELKGLGMVESNGSIPVMEQERADSSSQGTQVNEIDKMANVNYANLPEGVESWYNLVDESLKVEGMFMLSIDVFRNLDLSEPIFVEQFGGYYIIEEVSQYTNGSTPVKVKLIKLISNLTGVIVGGEEQDDDDDQEPDTTPIMTISARAILANPPIITGNRLGAYSDINYFTPATATLVAKRVTGNPLIGQTSTYIGPTFTDSITISGENNGIWTQSYYNFADIPSSVEGWYEVQGFATGEVSANRSNAPDTNDPDDLESNIEYVYFSNGDDITNEDPNLTMSEDKEATKALPSGTTSMRYTVENMATVAGNATTYITYEKYSETLTPTPGLATIVAINESGVTGKQQRNVDITFADGPGFYRVKISNTEFAGLTLDKLYVE